MRGVFTAPQLFGDLASMGTLHLKERPARAVDALRRILYEEPPYAPGDWEQLFVASECMKAICAVAGVPECEETCREAIELVTAHAHMGGKPSLSFVDKEVVDTLSRVIARVDTWATDDVDVVLGGVFTGVDIKGMEGAVTIAGNEITDSNGHRIKLGEE